MKHTALLAALAALLIANQSANAQGALNPPGAPAESQKSLQEIYDAIQSAKAEFATLVQQAVPSVPGMVAVLGGTLADTRVETFYIGKTEVTWEEWQLVRDWAVENGYTDLIGVGEGTLNNFPVKNINFFDVIKWTNAKSEMEGLLPVYSVNSTVFRTGELELSNVDHVIAKASASGYRLPTEYEWEWAARGGVLSKGFPYSGGSNSDDVAWHLNNSNWRLDPANGSKPVASKTPNELGIYDMNGNVGEFCFSFFYGDYIDIGWEGQPVGGNVIIKGGSYMEPPFPVTHFFPAHPLVRHENTGFRTARNY